MTDQLNVCMQNAVATVNNRLSNLVPKDRVITHATTGTLIGFFATPVLGCLVGGVAGIPGGLPGMAAGCTYVASSLGGTGTAVVTGLAGMSAGMHIATNNYTNFTPEQLAEAVEAGSQAYRACAAPVLNVEEAKVTVPTRALTTAANRRAGRE